VSWSLREPARPAAAAMAYVTSISRVCPADRDAVRRGMFRHERVRDFSHLSTPVPGHRQFRGRDFRGRDVPDSWTSRVAAASSLTLDDGQNHVINERLLPRIIPVPDSPRRRLRRALRRALARLSSPDRKGPREAGFWLKG